MTTTSNHNAGKLRAGVFFNTDAYNGGDQARIAMLRVFSSKLEEIAPNLDAVEEEEVAYTCSDGFNYTIKSTTTLSENIYYARQIAAHLDGDQAATRWVSSDDVYGTTDPSELVVIGASIVGTLLEELNKAAQAYNHQLIINTVPAPAHGQGSSVTQYAFEACP